MIRNSLVFIIISLFCCSTFADDPVNIPDANFKQAVEEALGTINPTEVQMSNLTYLPANDKGIKDLNGIEYATNLQALELENNQIKDISPLGGLTNLKWLWLTDNQISDISPVAGLTKLQALGLDRNKGIRDISPVENLTNLHGLFMGGNNISDISPVAGLTNIDSMGFSVNQISDISPIAGLTNLQHLFLGANNISDISPLVELANLQFLDLAYNQIIDISSLATSTNLQELHIEHNQISNISPIIEFKNLSYLNLTANNLSWRSYGYYLHIIESSNPGAEILYDPPPSEESPLGAQPTFDYNSDGIVDAADMCMMVDYWGTDEPMYDIAPPPFGDGIVDVQDLIMLAEHLFEEIFPSELVAYWKLDESEGDIAFNNTSDNHGILSGSPIWQPETGKVNGTLEFDGIDDYVSTDYVLNPEEGAFSAFMWIKGGAPGQMIISQTDGVDGTGNTWLGLDAASGNLMTALVPPPVGRFITIPLVTEAAVTDGQWYYIGFVWDGSYRSLYVDGIEVAKDANPITLAPLKSATGGLHIGAGKNLEDSSYFSGLIDDVRIYNIALTAEGISTISQ